MMTLLNSTPLRLISLLSIAVTLCMIVVPAAALQHQAASAPTGTPEPTPDQQSAPAMSFLRLETHDNTPVPWNAAIYGAITAAHGGALCVCRQRQDARPIWAYADSGKACWPDSK
jgi:hypothetical protein